MRSSLHLCFVYFKTHETGTLVSESWHVVIAFSTDIFISVFSMWTSTSILTSTHTLTLFGRGNFSYTMKNFKIAHQHKLPIVTTCWGMCLCELTTNITCRYVAANLSSTSDQCDVQLYYMTSHTYHWGELTFELMCASLFLHWAVWTKICITSWKNDTGNVHSMNWCSC